MNNFDTMIEKSVCVNPINIRTYIEQIFNEYFNDLSMSGFKTEYLRFTFVNQIGIYDMTNSDEIYHHAYTNKFNEKLNEVMDNPFIQYVAEHLEFTWTNGEFIWSSR